MENSFFTISPDKKSVSLRLLQLQKGKVGFYSVGLYPASLAYNCALQKNTDNLLLAPRPGRDILGAFSDSSKAELDPICIEKIYNMSTFIKDKIVTTYTLSDLLLRCEIVVLSANSNHIEADLEEACKLRESLNRNNVVLAVLVGSFTYNKRTGKPSLLCQKKRNLAFFSGFHRHGALRNRDDSFTANFCHPDPFNALLGSLLLDRLSPNIQVSAGVHNVEGQYIKASKNISSIFAGFAHTFHRDNPGILPTLLTLLLHQCLDQAATVSMSREDKHNFYSENSLPLTEIGYGVQKIEAAISKEGNMYKVRDHTFTQLTAMVADVKGSMMLPVSGSPTRNFQVGQILARKMHELKRCPFDLEELIAWCQSEGLKLGALEGINSLKCWPEVFKQYSINYQDSSMICLLYMALFSSKHLKKSIFNIMTNTRQLTRFCQESVRPESSLRMNQILGNIENLEVVDFIYESILANRFNSTQLDEISSKYMDRKTSSDYSYYNQVKESFEELSSY